MASESEKLQTIRRNILADMVIRLVQWALFLAIVGGLVCPLAWSALHSAGIVPALVVLALGVACAWHVRPHGRSYAAQCRAIDARYKPHD